MKKQKSYKYRLLPNMDQRALFEKTSGCSRFIWNQMLADKKAHYERTGKLLQVTPAQYKKEFPWLREVDSLALANVQLNLNRAYKSFFQLGFGFPRFKTKKAAQSYKTNNQKGTVALLNGEVRLPKVGWVKVKLHRQPKGEIKSAIVSKSAAGRYYISIVCEEDICSLPKTDSNIGVDLGLASFATLSTGEKINNPRFFTSLSEKLAREQRILSRRAYLAKKRGCELSDCRNYQKQKLKVARIYEKISNQRRDFLNKLSTEIIKNHDVICIEDLASKNLMKNRYLAKAIGDASWYEFVRQLTYKADWYGKKIVKISRWFPSSQLCSACGFGSGKKPLSIREWTCPSCHAHHDRDVNASLNILKEGLRLV